MARQFPKQLDAMDEDWHQRKNNESEINVEEFYKAVPKGIVYSEVLEITRRYLKRGQHDQIPLPVFVFLRETPAEALAEYLKFIGCGLLPTLVRTSNDGRCETCSPSTDRYIQIMWGVSRDDIVRFIQSNNAWCTSCYEPLFGLNIGRSGDVFIKL